MAKAQKKISVRLVKKIETICHQLFIPNRFQSQLHNNIKPYLVGERIEAKQLNIYFFDTFTQFINLDHVYLNIASYHMLALYLEGQVKRT
jgi:hypothetical protein